MPIVATAKIKPLMKLAEPVESLSGRLLLNKGVVITKAHIECLKSWGINEVSVEEDSNNEPPTQTKKYNSEDIAEAIAISKKMFRHANPNHPAMKEMFRLVTINNLKILKGEEHR